MPKSSLPDPCGGLSPGRFGSVKRRDAMVGPFNPRSQPAKLQVGEPQVAKSEPFKSRASTSLTTRRTAVGLFLGAPLLSACANVQESLSQFSNPFSSQPATPAGTPQQPVAVGTGQVRSEEHTS